MEDIHVTRLLLWGVVRGELPTRSLVEIAAQHLAALCPTCKAQFEDFQRELQAARENPDYRPAFERLRAFLAREGPAVEAEERRSKAELQELLALPQAERIAQVNRARTRFRSPALGALLLEESQKRLPAEPEASYDLARVADAVSFYLPEAESIEVKTRAFAFMGNAQRILGDLREAERLFAFARRLVRIQGVTDHLVVAELDGMEASLRRDQRRFEDAELLLTRSILLYQLARAPAEAARSLLILGALYNQQGDPAKAAAATRRAQKTLHPEEEPRLYLCACHNLAGYLCEAGEFREAQAALDQSRELYRRFPDSWTQLRLTWLEGKIARGLGELDLAEAAFLGARQGFIAERRAYDAALVSLELALLYAETGRTAELKELLAEVIPIFEEKEIHREALAALLLFQDAARLERVTVETVKELVAYLRRAERDPALSFREPS